MSDDRPICVVDSGFGGFTVVRELFRLLPNERIVYLGDTMRYPYGNRSVETIQEFCTNIASFLASLDIKLLVVACNTISAVAMDQVRQGLQELPVIGGVIPCCKAAVSRTASHKIGVIGTTATIRSNAYTKALLSLDPELKIYGKACPLFVPLVDEGLVYDDVAKVVAQNYLYELVDIGVDCLILASSHYPLLLEVIQSTVTSRIEILDTAFWTANEVKDIIEALGIATTATSSGVDESRFFLTDCVINHERIVERFLGSKVRNITKVTIENRCHSTV